MNTTEDILQLPHIGLNSRALLPEKSGIYYVLDETSIIWYIGQAQNLRSRWAGDSHHRLYQLQKQRKKQLTIYYEILAKSQLDAIERISPYKEDLVKLLFNEDLDTSKLQILPTALKTKEESSTDLPVRLANLAAKKEYLKSLLIERGLDLRRYQVNKYLERIPRDESYVESNHDRRMIVYVKSFIYGDLRQPIYYTEKIQGSQGLIHQLPNLLNCPYKEVYLTSTVDRAFWLLLEPYLSDFAKVELNEEEGYINKVYVSARKFIVPTMLTVTLNGKWKADIPFGSKNDMSCSEVANIIKGRLQNSGIAKLKFLFKSESTRT